MLFAKKIVSLSVSLPTAIVISQFNCSPVQASSLTTEEFHHFMVAIDGRETLSFGDYEGLANPNLNRLTMLYPHFAHDGEDVSSSHFHSIGSYSYTGSVDSPTVIDTSTNNQIPEYWTELPPINLVPGTGVFADSLVNEITASSAENYNNLKITPIQILEDNLDDPAVNAIYNSSDGAWTSSLGDAEIALELISITNGLNVANQDGTDLFEEIGDTYFIGQGNDFSLTPVFHTDTDANSGNYSAEFRLVDLRNDAIPESNAAKLRSKALIGKGSRGGRGGRGRKRDRREINSCQTQDFKIISPPAPSSPPAPPALKEFSAYLSAIHT